jgi:UDP-N-acetylmuramyl pentapeptide phosphotransferase/UDP-N-acetylglucosamine-1-phosphate transferase
MNAFRMFAIVLIVAGAFMLATPMLTYTTKDKVVDLGPVEINKQERHSVPLPPLLGGALVVIGIGLLVTGVRKPA